MKAFIKILESSCYCECCGSYENVNATIKVDGREDYRGYDTHFGNGNWEHRGDYAELYLSVLNLTGYTVEFKGEYSSYMYYHYENFSTKEQLNTTAREEVNSKGVFSIFMSEITDENTYSDYYCQKIELNGQPVWISSEEDRYNLCLALEVLLKETLGCELDIESEFESDWPVDEDEE